MINKIKKFIVPAVLLAVFGFSTALVPSPVLAANAIDEACVASPDSPICQDETDINDVITIVVNVLLFVIGLISVVMIIIGGIMYTTSAGNANSITRAKNTILYSVIGLVVAFVAYAIVNWVVAQFIVEPLTNAV